MKMNPSKPLKVVLIDDETAIITLLEKALLNKGYEVATYGSASECLNAYQGNQGNSTCQQHADIILTDIDMPHMDGIDFLNLLHKRNCPCQHIALMTGDLLNDARFKKIEKSGVKLFLKPFSIAEFIGWVSLIQKT